MGGKEQLGQSSDVEALRLYLYYCPKFLLTGGTGWEMALEREKSFRLGRRGWIGARGSLFVISSVNEAIDLHHYLRQYLKGTNMTLALRLIHAPGIVNLTWKLTLGDRYLLLALSIQFFSPPTERNYTVLNALHSYFLLCSVYDWTIMQIYWCNFSIFFHRCISEFEDKDLISGLFQPPTLQLLL